MQPDNIRPPRGIIFDLGDTVLTHTSNDLIEVNRRLLELAEVNPGVTPEEVQRFFDDLNPLFFEARDTEMIEFPCQSLHRLVYGTLGITFRVGPEVLEREFWDAAWNFTPVPGIYELLDTLDTHGIRTGILSNTICGWETLRHELDKHDLAERFSFIVTSADYGVRKPHPFIFGLAVKKMGLDPSDIWFVGDKPQYDIKGALGAGLYPIWHNPRRESRTLAGEYLEISDMGELTGKIAALYA